MLAKSAPGCCCCLDEISEIYAKVHEKRKSLFLNCINYFSTEEQEKLRKLYLTFRKKHTVEFWILSLKWTFEPIFNESLFDFDGSLLVLGLSARFRKFWILSSSLGPMLIVLALFI